MINSYNPKDAALDTVAVILVLLPEPTTTAMGIALLARPRGKGAQNHPATAHHQYHNYPEYQYRMENIRGREITWEIRTNLPGQLPYEELNKPVVDIRPREQYIYPRTQSEARPAPKLPPGVKVHHEIYRPSPLPLAGPNVYIPGETIHHTLKEFAQQGRVPGRGQPEYIQHTIENSPGYIKAQSGGITAAPQSNIIHHTIQSSPGAQKGNPANIVRPVRIVQHHELDKTPPININGRIVRLPSPPPNRPRINGRGGISGYSR